MDCTDCNCNRIPNITHLKGTFSTKYNISKSSSPKMPVLGKGTECLKLLLSQASKERNQTLVPMLFFHFGCTFERNRVSLSRPKLEGTVRNDGQPRCRKQRELRIIAKPQKALCGGFRSLGRRVGHRTADCAAEREYATFSRRLLNGNMPPVSFTSLSKELPLAKKAVTKHKKTFGLVEK